MSGATSEAVICIGNEGNEASLRVGKVYKTVRDDDAQSEGFLRVSPSMNRARTISFLRRISPLHEIRVSDAYFPNNPATRP